MIANSIIILIVLILVSSIVLSIVIRNRYSNILADIHDPQHRESAAFYNEVLNKIVTEYKDVMESKKNGINTYALVDKYYHIELKFIELGEKFISKSSALMIVLGLLGTFYGLTLSIGELVQLLSTTSTEIVSDVSSITDGLISSVEGMSVAFITSLFGIGSSVIVTILNIFFNLENQRESVLIAIEEYLDNTLNIGGESNVLESSIGGLADSIEKNFILVTEVIREQLDVSTEGLLQTVETFKGSINSFDGSLNKFSENIRDFSEFNYHLKTNIQRMNVSFDDLTSGIKENNDELRKVTKEILNNR